MCTRVLRVCVLRIAPENERNESQHAAKSSVFRIFGRTSPWEPRVAAVVSLPRRSHARSLVIAAKLCAVEALSRCRLNYARPRQPCC